MLKAMNCAEFNDRIIHKWPGAGTGMHHLCDPCDIATKGYPYNPRTSKYNSYLVIYNSLQKLKRIFWKLGLKNPFLNHWFRHRTSQDMERYWHIYIIITKHEMLLSIFLTKSTYTSFYQITRSSITELLTDLCLRSATYTRCGVLHRSESGEITWNSY